MLSEEEAYKFLKETLEIQSDVPLNGANGDERLQFLDQVTWQFQHQIPWQNLVLLSNSDEKRSLPSMAAVVGNMQSKIGGLCYGMNLFMCELMKALGFDAYIGLAAVSPAVDVANHYVVFIRDVVNKHDLYLIDVGFGYPTFKACCMNFDKETEVYQHSFCKFKFARRGDTFYRLKYVSKPQKSATESAVTSPFNEVYEDGWVIFYRFRTDEIPLAKENIAGLEKIYVDSDSHFLKCLRVSGFVDGKALVFKDNLLLVENSQQKLEATKISDDDLPKLIRQYYPQLEEKLVHKAVRNYQKAIHNQLS